MFSTKNSIDCLQKQLIYFYKENSILQQINRESRLREERDQTHKIYTGSRLLKGYIQSSLPTSKENSLVTLNCKPYKIKTPFCTLQESQNTSSIVLSPTRLESLHTHQQSYNPI